MTTEVPAVRRTDLRGLDLDEAVGIYEGIYNSGDIHVGKVADDGFTFRYRVTGDENVAVGTSVVGVQRWGTVEPDHHYSLVWAIDPGMRIDTGVDPFELQVGVPAMYPGRDFRFEIAPGGHHLIRFEGDFLEGVAAARHGEGPRPLEFTRDPDPDALSRLRSVLLTVAPDLLDPEIEGGTRGMLNTRVAEAVVDAFDMPFEHTPTATGRVTMRLAQEFMVEHAAEPLTITEVARALGVGTRTLQAAFRQYSGTTPLRFLRDVRLHRIRAALRAGTPHTTSVAEEAEAWGLNHPGRFATAYIEAYGERPSDTLRRR